MKLVGLLRHSLVLAMLVGMLSPELLGQSQTIGHWSTASYTMPINPIHAALLSQRQDPGGGGLGKLSAFPGGCPPGPPFGSAKRSGALLLNPSDGNITRFNLSWDMFCNGMVVLPDGRAFINGGTLQYDPFHGQPKSAIFDPATNTFTDVPNMAHGRWYPTVTTLGDGRVMTFSGTDETRRH